MGVDGGVAGRARQVLVLPVGDVLVRSGIPVLLGQAEVDDVDQVALFAQTHEKVVGLHVSVDEVLGVDVFDPADLEKIGFRKRNDCSTASRRQNVLSHPGRASTQRRFFRGSSQHQHEPTAEEEETSTRATTTRGLEKPESRGEDELSVLSWS